MLLLSSPLAIDGGQPIRKTALPYGRQWIDAEDVNAVENVLRSDWLTTGPKVVELEQAFATYTGSEEAVAVSNGTAALHAAVYALGIGLDDEVIVPAITFVATANSVLFQGATPVFVDVEPDTLLLDLKKTRAKITSRTKAIIAVDYAGQPCDYDALQIIADQHELALIADACHSLGGSYKGQTVGTLADLNTFSLHPVKSITSGEGGIITTNDSELARRMRIFRNHGISTDHRQRAEEGDFLYEMVDLGYNYRITDFQCALGLSQLQKLPQYILRRQEIASRYARAFVDCPEIQPLLVRDDVSHAYHLFTVKLELARLATDRAQIVDALRAENIGVNVHYMPVYWHPYYRNLGYEKGSCQIAETVFQQILSLPIFPMMTDYDVNDVINATKRVLNEFRT